MTAESTSAPSFFAELGLPAPILQAITDVGYETPSPIQSAAIPAMLAGKDMIAQAQTGTGKTAAFALPLLSNMDPKDRSTQAMVLAPTRELAIQVAEACETYAKHLPGFRVLAVYGGQSMSTQVSELKRGVQLIVGTPGRIMDHMRRGTLKLDNLKTLILDEADEMLRMGFIDDVEWILEQTPKQRQIALFSATMPAQIKRIAERYLTNPEHIKIVNKTATAERIRQRVWQVSGVNKLDALSRIIETEESDATLIFVRTRISTEEVSEQLNKRGFAAEALHGDIPQAQRERIVERLRRGELDILVATDVVARGLDVERISHVINFDIPYDTEAYIHRIGRTGRAGRAGDAILFVAPRERRLLAAIERATRQPIEDMPLPTAAQVNAKRKARFQEKVIKALENPMLAQFTELLTEIQTQTEKDPITLAAALAVMLQGNSNFMLNERETFARPEKFSSDKNDRGDRSDRPSRDNRFERGDRDSSRGERGDRSRPAYEKKATPDKKATALKDMPDVGMQRFKINVGYQHGVQPKNIVGAIANEGNMESRYIGQIDICDDYSTVDLPASLSKDVISTLQKTRICGVPMGLSPFTGESTSKSSGGGTRSDEAFKPKKSFGEKSFGDRSSSDRPAGDRFKPKSDSFKSDGFKKDKPKGDGYKSKSDSFKPKADGFKPKSRVLTLDSAGASSKPAIDTRPKTDSKPKIIRVKDAGESKGEGFLAKKRAKKAD
jgi:ATP-dependent RNA helicase DeaD